MKYFIIIVLLFIFAACSGNAAVTGTGENNKSIEAVSAEIPANVNLEVPTVIPGAASGAALKVPPLWVTEHGAYYINSIVFPIDNGLMGSYDLIHIIDSSTGADIVLCSRLSCTHDSEDCAAFLPGEKFDMGNPAGRGWWDNPPLLFVSGEHIYALNNRRTFYRYNLDGSGRTEHVQIPDMYSLGDNNWLMNGKLYMEVHGIADTDEFGMGSVAVILEVDYENKNIREVWRTEANGTGRNNSNIVGARSGKFFIMEITYPDFERYDCADEYRADYDAVIISVDSVSGQQREVYRGNNIGSISENGVMLYHSQSDEALYRLCLLTGTQELLAGGLPGYLYVDEELDGRVVLYRFHEGREERWVYNFTTGVVTELFMGQFLYEEDGYFFIETESEDSEEPVESRVGDHVISSQSLRYRLGRIPKTDYWENNTEAIKDLGWLTADEWWELLIEKQNWNRR
jgi:hypothetical protein